MDYERIKTEHAGAKNHALPDGNGTSDRQLAAVADSENRVLVTKDRDPPMR
jgi:predicted nuclease of predicted toxin-antitoxin system